MVQVLELDCSAAQMLNVLILALEDISMFYSMTIFFKSFMALF